jgi:ATP/ADP translocase
VRETRLQKIAHALFQVQPGELRRTALMFLYLLLAMNAFITARTVKDTLFLSYYDINHLPYVMMAVAVVSAGIAVAYSRLVDRFRRDRLIFTVDVTLGLAMVVSWWLIREGAGDWVFPAAYILVEAMGILIVVTFWMFANELFTSREAKRVFAIISAGGVLANVTCGLLINWLVKGKGVPTADLFLLVGACLFAGAFIILFAAKGRSFPPRGTQGMQRSTGLIDDMKAVAGSAHLRYIAAAVVTISLAVTFVEYTYKVTLRQHFHGDQMTVFQSWFVLGTGVFGCIMQFFITGRLIERFGIMVALVLLPVGMGSGLLYYIPTMALAGAVWAKASDFVFRYTINDSTMQLLYIPVNPALRGRAKAFIDGMLKQMAAVVTAAVVIVLKMVNVPLNRIAIAPALLIALWLFLITRIKREYLKSLMSTLRAKSLDLAGVGLNAGGDGTANALAAILTDPGTPADQVLHALDLVLQVKSAKWPAVLTAMLSHADPRVRSRAIELLGAFGWNVDMRELMKCMQDPDEQVRATVIQAFCSILKERAVAGARDSLHDPSPMIRAAAVSGLVRHCGLDGMLEAADTLKKMIENSDPAERFWGARAMRQIAVPNFYNTLLKLLDDQDLKVEKEAIAAAGEMRSREIVTALVYKLGRKGVASAAAATLARYGDDVVETLHKVLANPGERRELRLRVPRILDEIGTPRSLQALTRCIGEADGVVRLRIASFLAKFRRRQPESLIDRKAFLAQISGDIRRSYQDAVTVRDLAFPAGEWNLLREALEIRFKRQLATALRLVECVYPRCQMSIIIANLSGDNAALRANAIEAVDNMVPRSIGRQLVPLIESGDPASRDDLFDDVGGVKTMPREEWLKEILEDADPWLTACAIHEVRTRGPATLMPLVAGALKSNDALVRETALHAMLDSSAPLVDPELLAVLARDKSALVAGFATELLAMIKPSVPEATR